jgi:hypothetical protein
MFAQLTWDALLPSGHAGFTAVVNSRAGRSRRRDVDIRVVDIPVVDTLRMQAFRSTPVRGLDSMVWTALDPV